MIIREPYGKLWGAIISINRIIFGCSSDEKLILATKKLQPF
jgi:hypothetical protein